MTAQAHSVRRKPAGFYDLDRPVNRFLHDEYTSVARALLREAGFVSLDNVRVVDVGCGHAQWMVDFRTWGVAENRLSGIDLDPARITRARERVPGADLRPGSAVSLPWGDGAFDIAVQSTLFTSVLRADDRHAIAREMARVIPPGGAVLWYDFVYNSPGNPNVRGVGIREIAELFPQFAMRYRRVTLAPPIARTIVPLSLSLARLLDRLPFLRTHVVAVLTKPEAA